MPRRRAGKKYQERRAMAILHGKIPVKRGHNTPLSKLKDKIEISNLVNCNNEKSPTSQLINNTSENSQTIPPTPGVVSNIDVHQKTAAESIKALTPISASMGISRLVNYSNLDCKQSCLTSLIRPELVLSAWYNQWQTWKFCLTPREYVNKQDMKKKNDENMAVEKYLDEELTENDSAFKIQDINAAGCSKVTNPVIRSYCSEKAIPALEQYQNNIKGPNKTSAKAKVSKKAEIMQRIKSICDQDKLLFEIKRDYEMRVAKMTECHLNEMHTLELQHMTKKHELELKRANAQAELAELYLEIEKLDL